MDQVAGFSQTTGAKLDFRGSGITLDGLNLNAANGNTQVNHGVDVILVFGVTLNAGNFLFGSAAWGG